MLLNEHWQVHVGDFTLDKERFPTMEETIDIIHRRGFRIALTVQPFIGTESKNFALAVKAGFLVCTLKFLYKYQGKICQKRRFFTK